MSSKAKTKTIAGPEFEFLPEHSSFSDWGIFGGFNLNELVNSEQEMARSIET